MKTKSIFRLCAAALVLGTVLVGCKKEELAPESGDISDGTPRHLTVNITNSANTRALSAEFEDGTGAENVVYNVRFYFFDASGNKVSVKSNGDAFIDWTSTENLAQNPGNDDYPNETTEATTLAHLVINTSAGDKLPARIVAICNFDKVSGLVTNYATMGELKRVVLANTNQANAATAVATYANGDFIMSNSTFADRTIAGQPYDLVRFGTEIQTSNICLNEIDANNHPVNIYVERVVARVEGNIDSSFAQDGTWTPDPTEPSVNYPVFVCHDAATPTPNPIKFKGTEQLYVAVVGWNVNGVATKSTLGKIIETWASDLWGIDGNWSNATLNRSYWGQNNYSIIKPIVKPYNGPTSVNTNEMRLGHGTYNDAKLHALGSSSVYIYANAATKGDGSTHKYNKEALKYGDPAKNDYYKGYTEVVIAAVLLKKNADDTYSPLEVANWLGVDYAIDDLKTAYLSYIQIDYNVKIVNNSVTPATTTIRTLNENDLAFATIDKLSVGGTTGINQYETRRYAVYPIISSELEDALDASGDIITTIVKASDNTITYSKAEFNAALKGLENAKVWANGFTYYHFPLQHVAPNAGDSGKYGVVRNHIYRFSITDITGLGTPVYNPTETIIPEDVNPQYSYISAKINVLQWRVVAQDVALGN